MTEAPASLAIELQKPGYSKIAVVRCTFPPWTNAELVESNAAG